MELPCQCGTPQRRATEPDFPLIYDGRVDEYSIVYGGTRNGKDIAGKAIMRYCFWCGGSLPSKRSTLFARPSEDDISDIKRLMAQVQTADDMRRLLGEPDYIYTGGVPPEVIDPQTSQGDIWENHYTYRNRWQTLELSIFERLNGTVFYVYSGKRNSNIS